MSPDPSPTPLAGTTQTLLVAGDLNSFAGLCFIVTICILIFERFAPNKLPFVPHLGLGFAIFLCVLNLVTTHESMPAGSQLSDLSVFQLIKEILLAIVNGFYIYLNVMGIPVVASELLYSKSSSGSGSPQNTRSVSPDSGANNAGPVDNQLLTRSYARLWRRQYRGD